MAACDSSSDDYHLSNAEWYWGNISRYLTRLYIDNSHDPELLGHPNMFVFYPRAFFVVVQRGGK